MDNYINAVEHRLVLARRCLTIFNGLAALKLQLERNILKLEKIWNKFLHARSATAFQILKIVTVPLPPTAVLLTPTADPVLSFVSV